MSPDWGAALDELERYADAPALAGGWERPEALGPLPEDLASRVRALVAAQERAIRRLTDQQRTVASHLVAVEAIAPATRRSVYLDLDA